MTNQAFIVCCWPWPLKLNGDPKKRAGKVFWDLWYEFSKLDNRERYRI